MQVQTQQVLPPAADIVRSGLSDREGGNLVAKEVCHGEAPLIETTTATVSGVVDPQQMRDIPLNARSFIDLVPLQPGAVYTDAGADSAVQGFGRKLSVTGTRFNQNVFLLDGADINDMSQSSGSAVTVTCSVTSPTFRVKFTTASRPTLSVIPVRTSVRNPVSSASSS
jgi:hypothetical protein